MCALVIKKAGSGFAGLKGAHWWHVFRKYGASVNTRCL